MSSAPGFRQTHQYGESPPDDAAPQVEETFTTRTGRVLTGADIDALAAEAEMGYCTTCWRPLGPLGPDHSACEEG